MRRTQGLVVPAGLAVLLALLLLAVPRGQAPDFRAARYTQIVDSLYVGSHLLTLEQAGGEEEGSADNAPDTGPDNVPDNSPEMGQDNEKISYHRPADPHLARLADWYYKNSYLRGDVQRFNEGSPESRTLFDLEHAQLAHVNPAAHSFRPSLQGHGRWLGRLLYADAGSARSLVLKSLDGRGAELGILPLTHPYVEEPQSRHGYVRLFGTQAPLPQQSGSIIHFITQDRTEVAHIWGMGDGILLRLVTPEPQVHVEIRIDGRALHGTGGEVYALKSDSVLLFQNHRAQSRSARRESASSAWLVRDVVAGEVAYDGASGVWQRSAYDPLLPRVQSLLAEVANSRLRDVDTDVHLTLLRNAEESAGALLAAALERHGGAAGTAPAAITLMDALSGALLALPSWPPAPATPEAGLSAQNENFTRHAVGSVAKILFAPAVLDTHPELLQLALPAASGEEGPGANGSGDVHTFSSVLGLPLLRQVQDDALQRDRLDFTTAVAASSNRYAVTLLTLGSSDPNVNAQGPQLIGPGSDRYYLNGRLVDHRPADLIFNPGAPDSLGVLGLPWVERLRHLLDLNVATPPGEARITRQYVWDSLPRQLQPRQRQRRMLDAISPEYENLRMEGIRNRRADFGSKFASLILGAGESRWSNVELAEAVATLIENRPVRAQLVVPPEDAADATALAPGYDFRPLSERTHQVLADAMAAVVHSGTAYALESSRAALARSACLRNEAFALFVKTGTPVLVEQHEAPEAALFNQMAKDRLFQRNAAGQIVYTGFSTAANPGGRVLTYRDLTALRLLRDRGTSLAAAHFEHYFLPRNQSPVVKDDLSACREEGRATPRVLWTRVMRMVAESNEAPAYAPVHSDGPVLSWKHACSTSKSASNHNVNGRHIVMLAATYPLNAVLGGGLAACQGKPVRIDVTRQPTHAVAAVVAIADPERMDRTLEVARKILEQPVADILGLTLQVRPGPAAPAPEVQQTAFRTVP